jgi:hypothetical protein
MVLVIGVPVGSVIASSTYTAVIVVSKADLCKVALLRSLGRNRGEFRGFASVELSMAEADGHRVTVVRTSLDL